MALGAGMGALMGKLGKSTIDREFQDQVRDMLKPGTSALFLIVEQMTTDEAPEGLSRYGSKAIKSSLSKEAEAEIQKELHGEQAGTTSG